MRQKTSKVGYKVVAKQRFNSPRSVCAGEIGAICEEMVDAHSNCVKIQWRNGIVTMNQEPGTKGSFTRYARLADALDSE